MSAVLKKLMPVMTVYYPAFAARFGTDEQNIGMVMNEYAERLDHHGVTGQQFNAGVEQLKREAGKSDYFPNPERFALICKEATAEKLPPLDIVLGEIIARRGAKRYDSGFEFSHPVIGLINHAIGTSFYTLTRIEFSKLVSQEYAVWQQHVSEGKALPVPALRLPNQIKPDLPDYLVNRLTPTCELAKLAAKRAQGAA